MESFFAYYQTTTNTDSNGLLDILYIILGFAAIIAFPIVIIKSLHKYKQNPGVYVANTARQDNIDSEAKGIIRFGNHQKTNRYRNAVIVILFIFFGFPLIRLSILLLKSR